MLEEEAEGGELAAWRKANLRRAMIDFLPSDPPPCLRPDSEDIPASLQRGRLIFLWKKKKNIY